MNYLSKKIKTLNKDQLVLYNYLISNNKLQVCIPTGAGKGSVIGMNAVGFIDGRAFIREI
jgi:replicative superfamily II helicase